MSKYLLTSNKNMYNGTPIITKWFNNLEISSSFTKK